MKKKLLPSPSCSSSSSFSTTSTFDPHSCNPTAAATSSCISGILRRILCSGSLPTHPSDHIAEETNSVKSDEKSTNEAKPSAGIVARLMGLDSMPEMKQNHDSITRSQSINSVGHFYKHLEGKHEKDRTRMSIREIPTFLELENEDFFILSFEEDTKSKQFNLKQRNEEQYKCKNRGSSKKTKTKRYDPEEAKEFILIDLKQKKKSRKRASKNKPNSRISTKNRHDKNPTRKVESECSSDELSPVSVLDSNQFLIDPEESTPFSGDSASKSPVNPRRKLSRDLKICRDELIPAKIKMIDGERFEEEIRKITEMELGESNWRYRRICEEDEEIGIGGIIEGFDSYVLEGLIDEFVEQMYYDLIFI